MRKSKEVERLERMLLTDSLRLPGGAMEEMKNELISTLENYFDVDKKSVMFTVTAREDGMYGLCLQSMAKGVKRVRTIK